MRRFARRLAAILMIWPGLVVAEDWQRLDGDAIGLALTAGHLTYANGAWQEFRPSGRTLYNAGEDSWGYWRVVGDQYCSQWPPSNLWACYDIEMAGKSLRFVGASGDITQAVFP